jgi:uncharacterized metal-binding protein (TIGR02443 family)
MIRHKRFIAGAICPKCLEQDTLAVIGEGDAQAVICVNCDYQERKTPEPAQSQGQLIGRFKP